MENKSNEENKIVCRKCGGPHFTIKCGKEKKPEVQPAQPTQQTQLTNHEKPEKPSETIQENKEKKFHEKSKDKFHKNSNFENQDNKQKPEKKFFKTTYRVKLSELPLDMSEEELMELTTDWGHIVRIKLLIYEESSTAYIDFGYEDEAEYFVEAIDKTPFEYRMISACRVESFRADKTN